MRLLSDKRVMLMTWIAIFIMKLVLGISHFMAARRRIAPAPLNLTHITYQGTDPTVRTTLDNLSSSVNQTLDIYQRNAQRDHLVAAGAYFIAAATSLSSIVIELKDLAASRHA